MRTSRVILAAIAAIALGLSAACGTDSTDRTDTLAEENREWIEDVGLLLVDQGFDQLQIAPLYTNAAYHLMPFGKALGTEYDLNSEATCYFFLIGEGYRGSGAASDYSIKYLDSKVDIWVIPVDSEGAMALVDYSTAEPVTVEISDVTPELFNDNEFDLTGCGDTKLE